MWYNSCMAKRKSTTKKSRKKLKEEEEDDELIGMRPETKRWILIVVFFVVGIISLLSLFTMAGPLGEYWALALTRLFGWGDLLVPLVLFWFAYLMMRANEHLIHKVHYWGLGLLVFSFYAILHWSQGADGLISAVAEGKGGGYVGLIFAWPLIKVLGPVAGFVVLLGLAFVAILLLFDNITDALFGEDNIFKRMYAWLMYRGEEEGEFDDAYDDEDFYDEEYEDDEDAEYDDEEGEEDGEDSEDEDDEEDDGDDEVEEGLKPSPTVDGIKKSSMGAVTPTLKKKRMPRINMSLDLLSDVSGKPQSGDIDTNQEIIRRTLETFGIEVTMGEVNIGPTVTQYTLRPAEGVKLNQINTLRDDIALALAAHPIRIEAPIPGKSLVGIEVPNKSKAIVSLREVLGSQSFKKQRKSSLSIPFGMDVAGQSFVSDLATMPHLLIAGATGSGKSIAINTIIISLMYQNQPDLLKFILVDPKRVELMNYKSVPHLLTPVITDVKKTVASLRWAVNEMDRRYTVLSHAGHRQVDAYNAAVPRSERLPYIVVIIDELADLMLVAAKEVESSVVRIAQMARAVGIHLILATQRPSVDVITGLIKANIPARAAFSVASVVDSRTILDTAGAEKLLGRGDMLFISADLSKPRRVQGAFVSDDDIRSVTNFLREKGVPDYLSEVTEQQTGIGDMGGSLSGGADEEDDELLSEAKQAILEAGKASASFLQRRLRVGYARAARMLDILEQQGFIGPANGAKPREILADEDDVEDSVDDGYDDDDTFEAMPAGRQNSPFNVSEDDEYDDSDEEEEDDDEEDPFAPDDEDEDLEETDDDHDPVGEGLKPSPTEEEDVNEDYDPELAGDEEEELEDDELEDEYDDDDEEFSEDSDEEDIEEDVDDEDDDVVDLDDIDDYEGEEEYK